MKAIETRYNGYQFRSRLEARWAVWFDAQGIEYVYEPEGFELPSGWYLPDFWLKRHQVWIEVKAGFPTRDEYNKCLDLQRESCHSVVILAGDCWHKRHDAIHVGDQRPFGQWWTQLPLGHGGVGDEFMHGELMHCRGCGGLVLAHQFSLDDEFEPTGFCLIGRHSCDWANDKLPIRELKPYELARSARFESGDFVERVRQFRRKRREELLTIIAEAHGPDYAGAWDAEHPLIQP